uniref:Peptidase_M13 domain-containing protein n=1 Tax=Strongyloides papillosus TaxID=174720 RepID=A0A0N5BNI2_STREA
MNPYFCFTLLEFTVVLFSSSINSKPMNLYNQVSKFDTSVSEQILNNSIDEKIEPCIDFYQFACGKWLENNKENKKQVLYNDYILEEYNENFIIGRLLNNISYGSSGIKMVKIVYKICLQNSLLDSKYEISKKRCLDFIKQNMTYAVDALFIHDNISEYSKDIIIQIIENLKIAFREILIEQYSTDYGKLDDVLKKLDKIKYHVAYNNITKNFRNLDEYYSTLDINETNTFKEISKKLKLHKKYVLRNNVATDYHYYESTIDTSASYNFEENTFYLNAGYMNLPFFNTKLLKSMNYGSIGYIIGHEIAHAFDKIGINYNQNKNYNNTWNDSTYKIFDSKMKCFINQYNKYISTKTKKRINGKRTLNENIADNMGLEAAMRAYIISTNDSKLDEPPIPGYEKYNDFQLFYISFGQTHCTHTSYKYELKQIEKGIHSIERYRVIGAISNQENFKTAFFCDKATPMNPTTKCKL